MTGGIDVLVIGAGVTGLTTAVRLAEQGCVVRVRAADPPGATTSAVAGAIIGGPAFADPIEAAAKWAPLDTTLGWHRVSLAKFGALAAVPGSGVRIGYGRMVSRQGSDRQPWMYSLPSYRPCDEEEHAGFPVAFRMAVPLVDMPRYLDHLVTRLVAHGGSLEIGRVESLESVASQAPVVVNCAGLGARTLAADPEVQPVRGQHVVVENPGIEEYFFERITGPTATSIIPHGDRLVLGGTAEPGNANLEPDALQTEQILRRCTAVEPRIAATRVLGVHVGLRVVRPRVRLEEETVGGSRVVHNYGHGAVAVGLSWGCARDVARLVSGAAVRR